MEKIVCITIVKELRAGSISDVDGAAVTIVACSLANHHARERRLEGGKEIFRDARILARRPYHPAAACTRRFA